jgi:site-specific DNA-methyltransferase (adenine-specific)
MIVDEIREIYTNTPVKKLREVIEKHFIPTNEEKKQNAEVPTPVKLVDEMLDKIPEEFWKKPQKVFEPCCGKGNFVLGIFDKFYEGLQDMYPDEYERCRVIMTECIYFADLTALNVFVTTEIMKCHVQSYCGLDELEFEFNHHIGDTLTLDIKDKWNIHLEDVSIIGNPPYSTNPSKPDTKPLYDKFIEKYIDGKLLLFVVPSRWFIGGKGLDGFRDFMMKRKDIVFIQHEDDATKWFGNNVEIKGGVNYFMKATSHNGLCLFNGEPYDLSKYDCIIKPKYHKIINIVINMESISKLYMGRYFGVETNDKRFKNDGKIKCYVSTLKSKDRCKYIEDYTFNETNTFWKVITPEAAFKAFSGFGEKFIGKPNEVHTGSYISFRVNNEDEAKSLLSYLDTKFANHMLSVRKISQHINGDVCKWIPLVPLDRIWTDEKVCEYLKINQDMYI